MKKMVVVGSLNVDFVIPVQHLPAPGETILSERLDIVPGGKGANQAYALGRMGANVRMLGAVGADGNGEIELASLSAVGVDVSHVQRVSGEATGLAIIPVSAEGENSIIVVQGANNHVDREYIDRQRQVLEEADIVLLQLEIPLDTVLYTAERAKSLGKTVILDPAPAPDSLPDALLACVDYLKPNETELSQLSGLPVTKDSIAAACDKLLARGVGCVLASLGAEGVYMQDREGNSGFFPAEKVKAVDTTAAGDTFTAAIAYALAKGSEIERAIRFAGKAAASSVQRMGAQTSIPSGEEIAEIWASCE